MYYNRCTMARKNCVYCNKEITTPSREHVIQNALGGLYESEDICCPECNNYVSRHIDAPFTKIFNPIVGAIGTMTKTHNKNSLPPYSGKIKYDGQIYDATIKAGKVTSCPALSRKLRCDISKLPLEIASYDFDLDNTTFETGLAKIAFNYALAMNVDLKLLQHGLSVTGSGNNISKIEYNYPLVPFCPMNPVDTILELGTPVELFHNLILFSQSNQLWCYVDLFNTFQYYVLLSDKMPAGTDVYHNYTQTLRKIPRPEDFEIFSPKDAMIYAQQYGVEPTMNPQELATRVKNADLNKPALERLISKKSEYLSPFNPALGQYGPEFMIQMMRAWSCYFATDEYGNEEFIKENFRIWTPAPNGDVLIPYTDAIIQATNANQDILKQYTTAKFNKLNAHLINKVK